MIKHFSCNKNSEKNLIFLLELVKEYNNYDFYNTFDNQRNYVSDILSLKKFIKSSVMSFIIETKEEYEGLLLIWKGIGGNVDRYYIKVIAKNKKIVEKLLTVALWNFNGDLYAKISKTSDFLESFKNRGFKFSGGRGRQILLKREKTRSYIQKYNFPDKE